VKTIQAHLPKQVCRIEFLTSKWKRQKGRKLPSFIDKPIELDKIVKLRRKEAHAR